MFKIHPITNLINFIIFILILSFCNNTIVIFSISLLLLLLVGKHKNLSIYWIFTLIILVINILCGKLYILGRFLTLLGYLFTVFVDYKKIEFIRVYDTLFRSTNIDMTKRFLKVLYFKKYFIENYNIITSTTQKIGYRKDFMYYVFCIRDAIDLTFKSLDNIIYAYEKRFYFNSGRRKYKIFISIVDVFMFLLHLTVLVLILRLGV